MRKFIAIWILEWTLNKKKFKNKEFYRTFERLNIIKTLRQNIQIWSLLLLSSEKLTISFKIEIASSA